MKIEVIYFSKSDENTGNESGSSRFFHFFSNSNFPLFHKSNGSLSIEEMLMYSSIKIDWDESEQKEKININ